MEKLNLKGPKRLEGEDYETYKKRQRVENHIIKQHLNGRLVHESVELQEKKVFNKKENKYEKHIVRIPNTYVKPKKGK